jgi:glycosyltransferase involved in cell wall biosynthesis
MNGVSTLVRGQVLSHPRSVFHPPRALVIFGHNVDHARPQVRHVIELLQARRIPVDVAGPISQQIRSPGVKIISVPKGYGRWSTLATALRGCWRSLIGRYGIIIGFDEPGTIGAWPALARGRGCAVILYYLEYFDDQPGSRTQRFGRSVLERWGSKAALIVDVNEPRAEKRRRNLNGETKHAVIHNAARKQITVHRREEIFLSKAERGQIRLVYVGALNDRVYLDVTIQAMAYVTPEVHLFILGDDRNAYGDELKNLAATLHCATRVTFGGLVPRSRLASVLSSADIGIALYGTKPPTEQNEIFCAPNKIYEYMAAGLPVVCSNNQTLIELVEGNKWGIAVPPEDPEGIGKAINKIAREERLRREMSEHARRLHLATMNFECQAGPLEAVLSVAERRMFDGRANQR